MFDPIIPHFRPLVKMTSQLFFGLFFVVFLLTPTPDHAHKLRHCFEDGAGSAPPPQPPRLRLHCGSEFFLHVRNVTHGVHVTSNGVTCLNATQATCSSSQNSLGSCENSYVNDCG
jgi:hypothetical protein